MLRITKKIHINLWKLRLPLIQRWNYLHLRGGRPYKWLQLAVTACVAAPSIPSERQITKIQFSTWCITIMNWYLILPFPSTHISITISIIKYQKVQELHSFLPVAGRAYPETMSTSCHQCWRWLSCEHSEFQPLSCSTPGAGDWLIKLLPD